LARPLSRPCRPARPAPTNFGNAAAPLGIESVTGPPQSAESFVCVGGPGEPWPTFGGASAARNVTWLLAVLLSSTALGLSAVACDPSKQAEAATPTIIAGDCAGANCAIDPPGDDANAGRNLPLSWPAQSLCGGGNCAADQPDAVIIPQTPEESCGESECRVPRPTEAPSPMS
jgi:hypothetical protein